jgi:hypothetical protein
MLLIEEIEAPGRVVLVFWQRWRCNSEPTGSSRARRTILVGPIGTGGRREEAFSTSVVAVS